MKRDMYVGASNLALTQSWGGIPEGTYVVAKSGMGAGSVNAEVQAEKTNQAGEIQRLVITDFAINNCLQGGWTQADHNEFFALMWAQPGPVVMMGVGSSMDHPSRPCFNTANAQLQTMVAQRQNAGYPTRFVPWQPVLDAHPQYLVPDGLHLSGAEAMNAYLATINQGLASYPLT